MEAAYLVLENGMVFQGFRFGAPLEVTGEVVFTTGMTGYLETLTDKSYAGQIIVQTFPLIGNYGVIPEDFETSAENAAAPLVSAKGYIVHDLCDCPSNFRSEGALDAFLRQQQIPGIYGVDTRKLVQVIRESGVMNGCITADPAAANKKDIQHYRIQNAVAAVSVKNIRHYPAAPSESEKSVAVIDYGFKENIIRQLCRRGCRVALFPCTVTAEEIQAFNPDGIMLTNGPGDPAENVFQINELKKITALNIPMFGICLGHQLLALAHGFKTAKLKYGHRGSNQPVKDTVTGRIYISSQNHGYAVLSGSIDSAVAAESFYNVNDRTCEGISYKKIPAFSVQFHPEASSGPHDTSFLFDRFTALIEEYRQEAAQCR